MCDAWLVQLQIAMLILDVMKFLVSAYVGLISWRGLMLGLALLLLISITENLVGREVTPFVQAPTPRCTEAQPRCGLDRFGTVQWYNTVSTHQS